MHSIKKSILKKLKYFLRLSYWQKNMTDKPTWVYILQNLHSPPRYGKIAQQKPSLGKKTQNCKQFEPIKLRLNSLATKSIYITERKTFQLKLLNHQPSLIPHLSLYGSTYSCAILPHRILMMVRTPNWLTLPYID